MEVTGEALATPSLTSNSPLPQDKLGSFIIWFQFTLGWSFLSLSHSSLTPLNLPFPDCQKAPQRNVAPGNFSPRTSLTANSRGEKYSSSLAAGKPASGFQAGKGRQAVTHSELLPEAHLRLLGREQDPVQRWDPLALPHLSGCQLLSCFPKESSVKKYR